MFASYPDAQTLDDERQRHEMMGRLRGESEAYAERLAACLDSGEGRWSQALDETRGLAKLAADWDGEGASPVAASLMEASLLLLENLRRSGSGAPQSVYATAGGTPQFEWHFENGDVAIVNIREAGKAEVVRRSPGKRPTFEVVPSAHPVTIRMER